MKLILADDLALMRSCIIELLHDQEDIHIVAEAENGDELISKYFSLKPDLMLVDMNMRFLTGLNAVHTITEKDPEAKTLFLSLNNGEEYVYACYKAGGLGLLNMNADKSELISAIKKVGSGNKYFPTVTDQEFAVLVKKYDCSKFKLNRFQVDLTCRERKILKLISEGFTTVEIANKLFLSKRTIDTHRTHLFKKLNLRSLPQLIKFAIEFTSWYEMQTQASLENVE